MTNITHTDRADAVARATGWDLDSEATEREWAAIGLGPVGKHRDSGTLERSNFAVVLADLRDRFGDAVDSTGFGHWGVGWVEEIIWDAGNADVAAAVEQWETALADYPVADEMAFSELEYEEGLAVIRNSLPASVERDDADWELVTCDYAAVGEMAGDILSRMLDEGNDASPEGMRERDILDAAFALGFYRRDRG